MDRILRMDRMPHIWCPGCGLGTTVSCFALAVNECGIDYDKLCVVSGIGCTGRAAGYLRLDGYHTTHGRAIPFATGLHLANPDLKVVVISGDGDLSAIGGNHLIHAARRNLNLVVICVNNFIYGMTGGQVAPTTPEGMKATTSPFGCLEHPFNLPYLASSSGATLVARWTTLDVRQMVNTFKKAFMKKGFSFIEVISPCPELYMRRNKLGDGLAMMKRFQSDRLVKHGADPKEADLGATGKILVGEFVNLDRSTYADAYFRMVSQLAEAKSVRKEEAKPGGKSPAQAGAKAPEAVGEPKAKPRPAEGDREGRGPEKKAAGTPAVATSPP
ncbi:MAG: 2-oxoacid:ferredoxin oxidoreductase subunit beta [Planctomycetes bacterium]|nr:2-oxoacid:ferredoxin oxidoreductase subunit beta [Planctomycetota bacterium]